MENDPEPSERARILGNVLVGIAAAAIVRKLTKQNEPAVVAGLFAVIVHVKFHSPVTRRLSELGL
jgi:hypothetical protein